MYLNEVEMQRSTSAWDQSVVYHEFMGIMSFIIVIHCTCTYFIYSQILPSSA